MGVVRTGQMGASPLTPPPMPGMQPAASPLANLLGSLSQSQGAPPPQQPQMNGPPR